MIFMIYLFLCKVFVAYCVKIGIGVEEINGTTLIILAILLVGEIIFWKRTK